VSDQVRGFTAGGMRKAENYRSLKKEKRLEQVGTLPGKEALPIAEASERTN